jgi:hypothetical protein
MNSGWVMPAGVTLKTNVQLKCEHAHTCYVFYVLAHELATI